MIELNVIQSSIQLHAVGCNLCGVKLDAAEDQAGAVE